MTLDEIRNKVETFYQMDIRKKSRVEELVEAKVVFIMIAYDQGHHSITIANYMGMCRTTPINHRRKYWRDKTIKARIGSVMGTPSTADAIQDDKEHIKYVLIQEELSKMSISDVKEFKKRMNLFIKSKEWKGLDGCKVYEGAENLSSYVW